MKSKKDGFNPSTERAQTALTSDENRCITVDMVESEQETSWSKPMEAGGVVV